MEIVASNKNWDVFIWSWVGIGLLILAGAIFGIIILREFALDTRFGLTSRVVSFLISAIFFLFSFSFLSWSVYQFATGEAEPNTEYNALVDDPNEVYREGYRILFEEDEHVTKIRKARNVDN